MSFIKCLKLDEKKVFTSNKFDYLLCSFYIDRYNSFVANTYV